MRGVHSLPLDPPHYHTTNKGDIWHLITESQWKGKIISPTERKLLSNNPNFLSLFVFTTRIGESKKTKSGRIDIRSMGSIKKAIGRVKDQTTIGLVRVGSGTTLPNLEVAIVKATSHEEYPAEERHIREILNLTSCSQSGVASCVSIISARLDKTRNWVVALKVLILIQRLLQDGDPEYEREVFFATRRGTRLLNMSDFRDMSRSNSLDYSAFVRTYALYLDELLEYRMQGKRGKHSAYSHDQDDEEEEEEEEEQQKNENTYLCLFSRLQHLTQRLERFLACRPTGCFLPPLYVDNPNYPFSD